MGEVNQVEMIKTVKWNGRDYQIPRPNFETEAAYETFLEDRARDAIDQRMARGRGTLQGYEVDVGVWQAACATGKYAVGSKEYMSSLLEERSCLPEMLFLMMTQIPEQLPGRVGGVSRQDVRALIKAKREECIAAYNALTSPGPTPPPEEATAESTSTTSKSRPSSSANPGISPPSA